MASFVEYRFHGTKESARELAEKLEEWAAAKPDDVVRRDCVKAERVVGCAGQNIDVFVDTAVYLALVEGFLRVSAGDTVVCHLETGRVWTRSAALSLWQMHEAERLLLMIEDLRDRQVAQDKTILEVLEYMNAMAEMQRQTIELLAQAIDKKDEQQALKPPVRYTIDDVNAIHTCHDECPCHTDANFKPEDW